MPRLLPLVLLCWMLPPPTAAQTLEQRITAVGTGTVRLNFAARAGVCGDGLHHIGMVDADDEWEEDCRPQLVRVALQLRNGVVTAVRSYVGGRWRPHPGVADLGTVRPQDAADYFVSLVERRKDISGDPLLPAVLADSVIVWPSLLGLARNPKLPAKIRRTAVFWLAQTAGAAATGSLDSIAGDSTGDLEIRKQAVFALSQRPRNEGVPALLSIARSSPDPELRRSAIFWLGQSQDPRALALFEELLR